VFTSHELNHEAWIVKSIVGEGITLCSRAVLRIRDPVLFYPRIRDPDAFIPDPTYYCIKAINQGCGSGSGLDPDLVTLWIRIRIRIGNPDPGSGARKLRDFRGKMHFLVILKKILPLKRFKIAPTTFCKTNLMNNTGIFYLIWLKFWFLTKFEKKIFFESSVLAWIRIRNRNWIRIEQKCWIRIRIESIRIHHPAINK
jgi:hypothetical protein